MGVLQQQNANVRAGTAELPPTKIMAANEQQINHLLATIALRIRQSFKIGDILDAAVDEVRQFLRADRAIIYRFEPEYDGVVIAEALGRGWTSMLGQKIQDTGFSEATLVQAYTQGRFQVTEDIYKADLVECYFHFLRRFQIRANLVVPILQGEQLWGLLGVQQCAKPRRWQPLEIELSKQLAIYLAIALQQASLFEQLQAELTERRQAEAALRQVKQELEIRVAERTAQLQQANKRLERELQRHKQTERALQESEARFQRVSDSMPVPLWVSGSDGLCTFFNQAWLKFTGRTMEQELGIGWAEGVHPDDAKRCLETYQAAFNARQSFQMEYRLRRGDGEYRWVLDSGMPRFNLDGSFAGYIGSVCDISDRKQAEAERAKLIAILEATPDIVFTATVEQQLHYLNRAGRRLFGLDEGEELANPVFGTHPNWADNLIHNEGIPTAMRDGMWMGETAFIGRDGQEIPFSQLLIAHKSAEGDVNQLSGIARDISQQKRDEATRIESERRWRSLLDNVRLAVVGLNCDGTVEYVNPYFLELTGYDRAEVLGKNWFENFLPQYQRQQARIAFQETLAQRNHRYTHNSILTKASEERLVAWNQTLLQNSQGEVIGTTSIGEDITERYAIARMKDEFISVVSHELRTPLTSVHGALNLLSSGLIAAESEQGQQVIAIAAENAERLARLVNDILELERLESGKISLLKQWVKASELMHRAIAQVQIVANRAGVRLEVSKQEIEFEADGDRIIQVLTNLLSNAVKFSPRGSTVWLSVAQRQSPHLNAVLFKVQDQGRGIPADKIESIFERFHQVDASDSRQKGGTGLGLAICRSIVEQHGGQIWVESVLDEGSSFYFTLPSEDQHEC